MIDWVEVDKLLQEGYHPYSFKSGKGEYMCLKKGHATRGLGRFNQKDWDTLQAKYAIQMAERSQQKPPKAPNSQKTPEKEAKKTKAPVDSGQRVRLDDVLISATRDWQTRMQMEEIFQVLNKKWTPTQIVAQGHNPFLVEACAKKHAELTALETKPTETAPKPLQDQLGRQITSLQRQLEEMEKAQTRLRKAPTELMDILKPALFQGKLKMNQCAYFRNDLCTLEHDPNLMKNAPVQIIEEKDAWGRIQIHVKPTPSWCACCHHFQQR